MRCALCGQEMDPDYEREMGMAIYTDCYVALNEEAPPAGEPREEGGER